MTVLFVGRSAKALNPDLQISQYAHTAWRTQDGVFNGTPYAIAQTNDGYIWIGTNAGLEKFDGVRFVPWSAPPGQGLPSSFILSLLGARDGSLWIGLSNGLAKWKNNELVNFSTGGGRIYALLEDHAGTIWAARTRVPAGGLCRVAGRQLQCFGNSGGMDFPYGDLLAEDSRGNLWAGGTSGLLRWKSGSWDVWFRGNLSPTAGLPLVRGLAAGHDGSVWAALDKKGFHLLQLIQGIWKVPALPGVDAERLRVYALWIDQDNSLWIGTYDDGIYRLHGKRLDHFRSEDGLSSNAVESFFEDREGDVWALTSKGLDHFRNNRVASFSTREGLTTETVGSVLAARDGTVWIGNNGALDFLRDSQMSSIRPENGLPGRFVSSLAQDHTGRLWIGVENLLTVFERGAFHKISRSDGTPLGVVTAIAEDTEHNIWASVTGKDRRLFCIRDLQAHDEFSASPISKCRVLAADPAGGIWIGLYDGDLARYRNGKLQLIQLGPYHLGSNLQSLIADGENSAWGAAAGGLIRCEEGSCKKLSAKNGLPCNDIFALVKDEDALWAYAQCGVIRIVNEELERWWRDPDAVIRTRIFDASDGAMPTLANFQPGASRSPDGRLWFADDTVLQMVDPRYLSGNPIRPPVYIEAMIADRKSYLPRENLRLPPRTRDIEFDYTALSFVAPQKVRFRYKLEGRDREWQEPGARRQAFYTDLPPGRYRFQVIACNNDNLWNEAGAILDFGIAYAYYQTAWFRLLILAFGLGGAAFFYRLRVSQIERARAAQQSFTLRLITSQENERKRIAGELHDSLGQRLVIIRNLALLWLQSCNTSDSGRQRIEEISSETSGAIGDVKEISYNLRPYQLDRTGLTKAIESLVSNVGAASGISISAETDNIDDVFPKELQINFYRIVQEALNNIVKHSEAAEASVVIRRTNNRLSLAIRDNGKGIASRGSNSAERENGFGLTGMAERGQSLGGETSIHSTPGQGTTVHFEVELRQEA